MILKMIRLSGVSFFVILISFSISISLFFMLGIDINNFENLQIISAFSVSEKSKECKNIDDDDDDDDDDKDKDDEDDKCIKVDEKTTIFRFPHAESKNYYTPQNCGGSFPQLCQGYPQFPNHPAFSR